MPEIPGLPRCHAVAPRTCCTLLAGLVSVVSSLAPLSLARADEEVPPLPTPFSLASQLDFECHTAAGPKPAPAVWIRQLNPVLQNVLPNQQAVLGDLEDVCVPVAKNQVLPSPDASAIARWSDLACYEASAPPVAVDVNLSHLNPVLADLPDEQVKLVQLKQLCVPVRKNDREFPDRVRAVVSHFDFACYELEEPTADVDRPLHLTHLNPVIRDMNLPDRDVRMQRARRLCVPVGKANQPIPLPALRLVRWLDFLRYRVVPLNAAAVPAVEVPIPLKLTHLNPLFDAVDPFTTTLYAPLKLMVPVAKNGVLPPNGMVGAE